MKLSCRSPFPTNPLSYSLLPFSSAFSLIMLALPKETSLSLKYLQVPCTTQTVSSPCFSGFNFFPLFGILRCILEEFMENFIHIASWSIAQVWEINLDQILTPPVCYCGRNYWFAPLASIYNPLFPSHLPVRGGPVT